jgi:hypothetical protein
MVAGPPARDDLGTGQEPARNRPGTTLPPYADPTCFLDTSRSVPAPFLVCAWSAPGWFLAPVVPPWGGNRDGSPSLRGSPRMRISRGCQALSKCNARVEAQWNAC